MYRFQTINWIIEYTDWCTVAQSLECIVQQYILCIECFFFILMAVAIDYLIFMISLMRAWCILSSNLLSKHNQCIYLNLCVCACVRVWERVCAVVKWASVLKGISLLFFLTLSYYDAQARTHTQFQKHIFSANLKVPFKNIICSIISFSFFENKNKSIRLVFRAMNTFAYYTVFFPSNWYEHAQSTKQKKKNRQVDKRKDLLLGAEYCFFFYLIEKYGNKATV